MNPKKLQKKKKKEGNSLTQWDLVLWVADAKPKLQLAQLLSTPYGYFMRPALLSSATHFGKWGGYFSRSQKGLDYYTPSQFPWETKLSNFPP